MDFKQYNVNTFTGALLKINAMTNKLVNYAVGGINITEEDDFTIIPVTVKGEDSIKIVESGVTVEEYTLVEDCFEDDFDYSDEWKEREANDCA